MRTRSPSSAPPEKGDAGRPRAHRPAAPLAEGPDERGGRRRLADAGRAGDADDPALPAWGASAAITSRSDAWPSSTREMRRATARGEPALADSTRAGTSTDRRATLGRERSGGRGDADDEGVALAAAAAQRGCADAAAAALQLEREVQGDAGPDMPIGWPSAIAPPLTLTLSASMPSSLAEARPTAAKASLISTRSRSAGVMPSFSQAPGDGACRLLLQRRVGAGDHAVRADLGEPGQAELLGLGLAHDDDRGGAVGDLRGASRP